MNVQRKFRVTIVFHTIPIWQGPVWANDIAEAIHKAMKRNDLHERGHLAEKMVRSFIIEEVDRDAMVPVVENYKV